MFQEASMLGRPKAKRMKKDAIVGPAVDKDVAHEAVGLKAAALLPKEIPIIKKKNPILQVMQFPIYCYLLHEFVLVEDF